MHKNYVYEVNYLDGTTEKLTANIMDENMLSQVDSEGLQYQVLTGVTRHKRVGSAITKVDGFIKYINGDLNQKRTTRGW